MSGPPRVEQAADLAEELATVSQKHDMSVNKLKRQKVKTFVCFAFISCWERYIAHFTPTPFFCLPVWDPARQCCPAGLALFKTVLTDIGYREII